MTPTRFPALQWAILLALPVVLLYLLAPVLMPFLAAAILAYICQPLVARLCSHKVSRTVATLLVMGAGLAVAVLLVLILLPLLDSEFELLLARLPDLIELVQTRLFPWVQQQMALGGQDMPDLKALLREHLKEAGSVAGRLLPWITGSGATLLALAMNLLLVPLALFYLLRDWPQLLARVDALIPRRWYGKTREIAGEIDAVLAQFMRGQVAVMLLMSVYYVLGLWLVGLEFALPIGIVSGLLVFIPYVGMAVGLGLATLVAVGQFNQWFDVLWILLVFGAGQLLEGFVVTPRLVGDRIGLHPLAVIFALLAFGQLFGFVGVLLALPAAAVLLVCLRHLRAWYLSSNLYQE